MLLFVYELKLCKAGVAKLGQMRRTQRTLLLAPDGYARNKLFRFGEKDAPFCLQAKSAKRSRKNGKRVSVILSVSRSRVQIPSPAFIIQRDLNNVPTSEAQWVPKMEHF